MALAHDPTGPDHASLHPRHRRGVVLWAVGLGVAWVVAGVLAADTVGQALDVPSVVVGAVWGALGVVALGVLLWVELGLWAQRVRRAEEARARAEARVQLADETLAGFLRGVSHELRTPLTAVVGFADTAQRMAVVNRTQALHQMLDRLVANAHRLDRLVVDLLETNDLLSDHAPLRPEPVDLDRLVRRVVEASDLGDRTVVLEGRPLVLDLDARKMERALATLLANVRRHTPADAEVTVAWGERTGQLLLIVEDDGPGFPEDLSQRALDPFVQGAGARSSAQPGLGIGMALVAQLVRIHGGRMLATNRSEGGARVEVRIPVSGGRATDATNATSAASRTHEGNGVTGPRTADATTARGATD